jgi:glycosyltransferase involved in cell wall biosynthesis
VDSSRADAARAGSPTVLQVVANLDIGGAQAVVRTLARYLPEHGWKPVVVTLRDGPLRAELDAMGVTVEVVTGRAHALTSPVPAVAELARIRNDLAAVARRHEALVVQTHLLRSLDFLVLTLKGGGPVRAVFWTLHNARLELREDQLPDHPGLLGLKRLGYRLLYFGGARMADGFVAVARDVATEARRLYRPPRGRLHLIPNGVDADRPAGEEPAAVRQRLGIPPDARVVMVVAKLTEQKGHAVLLRAIDPLLERDPQLHLVVVGDGPLGDALRAQAAALASGERVHFLGERSDARDLLGAADLFVLPSLWEGLPIALLEAMAAGLPVVATAVSGTREVVVDGVTGILVPPGDEESLTAALDRLVTDRAAAGQMGSEGRRRVAAEFSGSRLAQRHAALYAAATGQTEVRP